MGLAKLSITAHFIETRAALTWREIAHGIDNELLSVESAVAFAAARVGAEKAPDSLLVDLARLRSGEPARDLVDELAANEPEQDSDYIRMKWLYLVLSWVFEHQGAFADPLAIVEEVYAEFDYPEEAAHFVPYMPMRGPDLGSKAANRGRLFESWKQYLDEARLSHGSLQRSEP